MSSGNRPFLFEISWEVCNKVGGIYTVITSKSTQARQEFPDAYLPVGPFLPSLSMAEFSPQPLPEYLEEVSTILKKKGVTVHYGEWLPVSRCPVVLLECNALAEHFNDYKAKWWEKYGIDTLGTYFYDVDQPIIWSIAAGMLVEAFANASNRPVIAHGHEWLSAGLFLHLDEVKNDKISTVFTTHATVLGRALSANNHFIYSDLNSIDPLKEARAFGVTTKHQLEKAAAELSTAFTTVSAVTASEAVAFLGKKPDVIVQNGIDPEGLPSFDHLCVSSVRIRKHLNEFSLAYFGDNNLDPAHVHYQFTMGRYEMHNKGYDLYLRSLALLNEELKSSGSTKTVISFFLVPGDAKGIRPQVTARIAAHHKIQRYLEQRSDQQFFERYRGILAGKLAISSSLFNEEQAALKAVLSLLKPQASAPLSPYFLGDEEHDQLAATARSYGLTNAQEDRVKVVLMPLYLDGFDGIFNYPLYELVTGFDLGVFPSVYEPWGYTPMESLRLGVPAITSNLSGFGQAMEDPSKTPIGLLLLDRSGNKYEDEAKALTALLHDQLLEGEHARVDRKMDAYLLMRAFAWDTLYEAYRTAYRLTQNS